MLAFALLLTAADPTPSTTPSTPTDTAATPAASANGANGANDAASDAASDAAPSLVDRVVTQSLLDKGRASEAKAVTPNVKVPGASTKKADDAQADIAKGEELLKKKDAKAALIAFQRALAKDPKAATPLWGISRAADAMNDPKTARRFAALYVKSKAPDRNANTASAAQWRLEQPDESEMMTPTTTPGGIVGPTATPTSATPTTPGAPSPLTPPPPTPY